MTGQEVVRLTPAQELAARVRGDDFKEQVALALPDNVSADRFVRVMATALIENPELAKQAEHGSILSAGLKAAADGLLPDGREAAFVVFKEKAAYMPMIGGFRKIAGEHGWSIRTQVVYANDEFVYEIGLEPTLKHVPVRPGAERGDAIAAYAVGKHRDGRTEVEVMTAAEIEKVRQVSRSKDRGPWVEWTERMWEKSAGRRLFAKLPLGDPDRVLRVLEAASGQPEDAAAALYGQNARAAFAANGEAAETPPAGTPDEPVEGEVVEDDLPAEPSAGSEPEPGPVDEAAATKAGETVIGNGQHKGKTIAEVAKGSTGESWINWCIRQSGHPCQADARTYAEHFMPAVYQAAVGQLEIEGEAS